MKAAINFDILHFIQQDGRNWQQIQLKIVKNTSSGVKFASQIPGKNSYKTFLYLAKGGRL